MNEQLISKAIEIMDYGREGIIKGTELLMAQAPILCDEILRYNFWVSLISWGLSIIIFTLALYIGIKLLRYGIKEKDEDYGCPGIVISVIAGALLIFTILILPSASFIKIKLAPRVYLMETFKGYIK